MTEKENNEKKELKPILKIDVAELLNGGEKAERFIDEFKSELKKRKYGRKRK